MTSQIRVVALVMERKGNNLRDLGEKATLAHGLKG